ncbi:RING-H2 finger protein ATL57-like [Typha angustifolia]|uniref:RING-H2 finger protein ATL57-like n=1 Tax=Typha angustifolia TaxID=59011 RepID=UPI003C2EE6CB
MRLLLNSSPITPPPRPYDPAESVRFNPSSMFMTAFVLLLALFFLAFFSVYARRLLSGFRGRPPRHPPPSPPQPQVRIPRRHAFAPVYGLDPSAVRSLPVLSYVGGGGGGNCVVCLSEFEEKERVKVIPRCGHVFHPQCIDAWLLAKGSCPVCRCSDMVTGSGLDVRRELREAGEGRERKVVRVGRSDSCRWRVVEERERETERVVRVRRTFSF